MRCKGMQKRCGLRWNEISTCSFSRVHTSCLMEALAGYGSEDDVPNEDPTPATDPAMGTCAVDLDRSVEIPGSKIATPIDDKNISTPATNFSFPAPPEDFDEH